MTAPADLILTNAEVHTLTDPDETASAVAIRDGELVRVGRAEEVSFLRDVETRVIDCAGRVVLPGFIDAHTHLPMVGRRLVNADLRAADSPDEAVAVLHEHARTTERATGTTVSADRDDDWVLGFGFDESTWDESRYLTRSDLDAVSADRPVAAFREDMHVASLNEVALGRLRGQCPTVTSTWTATM
jgi:predicted amidohydrolase YtcJ